MVVKMRIPEYKYGVYLLTCVCGLVDVTCFVGLHGVFSAMMTGNLLMFAIALADGAPLNGLKYVRAFMGFTIGVILASRLMKFYGEGLESRKAFWIVWFLIGGALILSLWRDPGSHDLLRNSLVNLLSMAMGAMATIVRMHSIPDLPTSLFTGTYTSLIAESALSGAKSDRWLRRLMSIFLFVLSGAIGGYLAKINPVWSLGLALFVMSIAMMIFHYSIVEESGQQG